MNTTQPYSASDDLTHTHSVNPQLQSRSTVSWGAIFAGVSAALALQVLFMMLGTGLGLAIFSPITNENPVASFSLGALILHSIGAIASLFLGGWVAGRFTSVRTRSTACLHGFSVWCAATVGGVLLVATGAGWMMGGLSSLAGSGLSAVGQPVAAVADEAMDLATDAMKQSGDTIESFVDEAMSTQTEDGPSRESIRGKREIGFAVGRLFNPAREGNTAANRDAAVTALVKHTDMSQADADRAITEWTETYERLQADLSAVKEAAETQTREAADHAASAVSTFAFWSFLGFLIAAVGSSFGGHLGAKCATKCEEETYKASVQHA